MREIIANRLWIGNSLESRNLTLLLATGVAAILDLAIEELPPPLVRELIYCRIPLLDGTGNRPEHIRLAVDTLSELVREQVPTYVFCGAGMSRSPAITAAALAMVERADPNVVLHRIVTGHPHDVSPALWQEVTACLPRLSQKMPS